ncbi:restriction endonuclease subunit S [Rhodovulum sp. 12E13]|uniref:restriction endonuclease subunit S n=1 Tax=Rhodovulum sp. 12E13 TaxID=2203891 RepID=UPI000E13DE5B|nr:restriction endonuclease subunit S [Rhodovulum sp. 12E13]RDC68480.1 restriction endonuclease subunit S [Rhodovulum sp. 12E13]
MTRTSGALRYFGRIRNGTTPASGDAEYWDGNVLWATPEDLGKLAGNRISETKRRVTEKAVEECNLPVLPPGSVIISTRAPIGHMAINNVPMAFNQGCRGIIPRKSVHASFLYYLLKSRVDELDAMANRTTFVELSRDELAAVPVDFPPLETQRRIARFLDEKTARIDGLIEKKRALLERLAEKRQALITRAVTKGLDPTAPMKPSGIDWLGDIPAHWEVLPLKRVLASSDYGISASLEPSGEVAVLRMGNLEDGEIALDNLRFIDEVPADLLLQPNDVIFNRTNSLDLVGKAAIFRGTPDYPVSLASYLVRFRFTKNYDPEYANFVMGTRDLMALARTLALPSIGQANLNPSRYAEIEFPIPSIREQWEICAFLNRKSEALKDVSSQIASSVDQLLEYRAALITAAVTGKIAELQ